ncbi:MAG TPA: hypothetical protein VK892_07490 [Pyrinomonadaceae bacterium]|nr:hypothetical protein [Pyrinomonadaceae bacterium]
MKKFFRVLVLGILTVAFAAAAIVPTFAQSPAEEKRKLYDTYIENYQGNEAQQKVALQAAKDYVAKFGANPEDKEQVDYFKEAIATIEEGLRKAKAAADAAAAAKAERARVDALYKRFDTATQKEVAADAYAAGKEILASEPEFLDVYIVLATMGYDEAVKQNDTYNPQAIDYAKRAIQLIEAGKPSVSKAYGAYGYSYKTKEFTTEAQAKSNALGWLNYNIGYIMFYRQKNRKDALPYIYKATQFDSGVKKFSDPYRMIGEYYFDEVARIDKERQEKIKANNNEDNEETLRLLAVEKGNADRAIDAYARAYALSKDNPAATKEYKDILYARLKSLYTFRHNNTDGMDSLVASVMNRPMPNPTTEVTPVVEEKTTNTSATTSTTTSTTTPSTKPASTATTTPVNSSTKTSTTTTTPKKPRKR